MSRAVFAERFARTVGIPPMQYLLEWRIAIAKEVLRRARAAGQGGREGWLSVGQRFQRRVHASYRLLAERVRASERRLTAQCSRARALAVLGRVTRPRSKMEPEARQHRSEVFQRLQQATA